MKIGFVLLAVVLILDGLVAVVDIGIPSQDTVLAVISILAGVFILLRR